MNGGGGERVSGLGGYSVRLSKEIIFMFFFIIIIIPCKALLLLAVTGQGSNLKLYQWSLGFESDSVKHSFTHRLEEDCALSFCLLMRRLLVALLK